MFEKIELTQSGTDSQNSATVTGKAAAVVDDRQKLLDERLANGSENEKSLIRFLNEYNEVMNTTDNLKDKGLEWQVKLYRRYNDLIERVPAQEFRSLWSILLLFADINRCTTFNAKMINRFSDLWQLGEDKLTAFMMVNNIVLLTADPKHRAINVKRQIDFTKSLEKYFSAEGNSRVVQFYKN